MRNKFVFDKVQNVDDFCGREKELKSLISIISEKNNALVYGERRYGKTSLIFKAFDILPENIFKVHVDLFDIVDEMDFVKKLYSAVVNAMPFSLETKAKELASLFSRVRFSMTPTRSGDGILFSPQFEGKDFDSLLEDAFEAIERLCKKSKYTHAVIAMDEFQQVASIKKVKIDAKIRTINQSNHFVCFIFSGSKTNTLRSLLSGAGQPLQGMTTPIVVKGIKVELIKTFCEDRLPAPFETGAFEKLYERVRGQTRLLLQVCSRLPQKVNPYTTLEVDEVLSEIIDDYDDVFTQFLQQMTGRKSKAIKAIGVTNGEGVFAQEILKFVGLKPQAMTTAIRDLLADDIIQKLDTGEYHITDIIMHLWAVNKFNDAF